jgi:fatty acid desaturase
MRRGRLVLNDAWKLYNLVPTHHVQDVSFRAEWSERISVAGTERPEPGSSTCNSVSSVVEENPAEVSHMLPIPVELRHVKRSELKNSAGLHYETFRAKLTLRYAVAWKDIALGYLALLALSAVAEFLASISSRVSLVVSLAGGAAVAGMYGYVFAYLHLFLHEAAHYNLASNRTLNDRLSNLFIGLVLLSDVKAYRHVHWEHHRQHGTPDDLESSYFLALSWGTFARAMTGANALAVLWNRLASPGISETPGDGRSPFSGKRQLILGAVLHSVVMLLLYAASDSISPPLCWLVGFGSFFPLFATIRPILEHRSERADRAIDYFAQAHGVVNRLFGDGLVASTFGGAGFNRHLLHHWEPQLAYTRLRELEDYLFETELAKQLTPRRTTYVRVFFQLWGR